MKLDLNCDLGEGESVAVTRGLMRWITSANIACGGHAGDAASMRAAVRAAQQRAVRVGAHPGWCDRAEFGRVETEVTPEELELLLLHQVGALERIARDEGARLHHLKLHGALYHASERSAVLARRYVESARRWWPRCVLYVQAGGRVERMARQLGVRTWGEFFADRAYCDDGGLVPRTEAGAIITGWGEVRARVETFLRNGRVRTTSGRWISVKARTICVHADTPGSLYVVRALSGFVVARP